jgi:hypothetical protein
MSEDDAGNENFEDRLRFIAREVSRSVERLAELDIDEIARAIGVDAERAKRLADTAGRWFSDQVENLGDDMPWGARSGRGPADPDPPPVDPDPLTADHDPLPADSGALTGAGPHPLDRPTAEQGLALSALDSGRWTVEPGSNVFVGHGQGPAPSKTLGLVGELRARDWIDANGDVTLVGRNALSRWVEDAQPR